MLTASNGAPPALVIWDAERKAIDGGAAHGAGGRRLRPRVDRGRQPADRRRCASRPQDTAAAARFKALTDGPIIVQSSKDPFLDWDDLQRATRTRTIAALNPADRRRDDDPAGPQDLQLPRDARLAPRHVHGRRDREDRLRRHRRHDERAARGLTASQAGKRPRTIAEAKDLKDVQLRWSDDGRMFAFAKKGEVFVQGDRRVEGRAVSRRGRRTKGRTRRKRRSDGAHARRGRRRTSRSRSRWGRSAAMDRSCSSPARRAGTSSTRHGGRRAADARADARSRQGGAQSPKVAALEWAPDGSSIYATYSAPDKLGARRDAAAARPPRRTGRVGARAARARRAALYRGADVAQRQHVRLRPVGRRPSRGPVTRRTATSRASGGSPISMRR